MSVSSGEMEPEPRTARLGGCLQGSNVSRVETLFKGKKGETGQGRLSQFVRSLGALTTPEHWFVPERRLFHDRGASIGSWISGHQARMKGCPHCPKYPCWLNGIATNLDSMNCLRVRDPEWPLVPCLTCPGCRNCHYCRKLRPADAQQTEYYCDNCRQRERRGLPLRWA